MINNTIPHASTWTQDQLEGFMKLDHSSPSPEGHELFREVENEIAYREDVDREASILSNHDGSTPY